MTSDCFSHCVCHTRRLEITSDSVSHTKPQAVAADSGSD